MRHWTRTLATLATLIATATVAIGCSKRSAGGDPDTNTNWLRLCESDSECGGEFECLCGACSIPCEASAECHGIQRTAACVPTHSCNDAAAVCAPADQTSAEARSGSSTASTTPPTGGGFTDPLCNRAIEEYRVIGECDGVDLACDVDDVSFEDACGCGCEALPSSRPNEARAGTSNSGGDGAGGAPTQARGGGTSLGGGASLGGGDPGETGGAGSGTPNGAVGGGSGTSTSPRRTGVGGAGAVACDDPDRVYVSRDPDACAETPVECGSMEAFDDECGCGCWQSCSDATRHYVSRQPPECLEADLACGGLPAFDDPCGCGCLAETPEDRRTAQLALIPADCPAAPAGDEIATRELDLAALGCNPSDIADEGLPAAIASEADFQTLLAACGAPASPSGVDFDEATVLLAITENTPETRFLYATRLTATEVTVGIAAYQWCSEGDPTASVLAHVVDVPNAAVQQHVCELMPCTSEAP